MGDGKGDQGFLFSLGLILADGEVPARTLPPANEKCLFILKTQPVFISIG